MADKLGKVDKLPKRPWNMSFGEVGTNPPDPATEIIRRNMAERDAKKMERMDETETLKHEAEKKRLKKEISGDEMEEKKKIEDENRKLREEVHEKEIQVVRTELGGKIDELAKSMASGASKASIADQIGEIKKAAGELGLGGSKFEDITNMLDVVEKIRPSKALPDQIQEAKALLESFGAGTKGASDTVTLELKKLESQTNLEIERMRDERSRRDKEWDMEKLKWQEERELRQQEIQGKLALERERNSMLSGGIDRLGRVFAQATEDGGASGVATKVGAKVIDATEGDFGEVQCSCGGVVPVAKDSLRAICPQCETVYKVNRIAKKVVEEATEEVATESELGPVI